MIISTPGGNIRCTFKHDLLIKVDAVESSQEYMTRSVPTLPEELKEYFEGKRKTFSFPIGLLHGTPFQKHVWNSLKFIPYGTTVTYSAFAAQIGFPKAVRAVASAIGKNPIPIIIPCHRVIGKQDPWKFGWGKAWKQFLLNTEGVFL